MSAISRAFTTRRVKQSIDVAAANKAKENMPQRSKTTKASHGTSVRNQISAPVELIHTTNMLSYNAPDISRSNSTSQSVKSSDGESDSINTAASSPPTSPDMDPREDTKSSGPAPNHLSCYFVAPSQTKDFAAPEVQPPPAIPKRAPSHTKKASYDAIARSRSVSSISKDSDRTVSTKNSMTFSRVSSSSTTASTMSHNSVSLSAKPPVPAVPPVAYQQFQHQVPAKSEIHPFGRELAQVSEIAEDYGIKHNILDAEEQALKAQGLHKFSAETYLGEIQDLFTSFLAEAPQRPHRPDAALWI